MIFVLPFCPSQGAPLGCARDPSSQGLINIDVLCICFILEVLDAQGDGAIANGLSLPPWNPLQTKNLIGGLVAQILVHDILPTDVENGKCFRGGHGESTELSCGCVVGAIHIG